MKIYERIKSEEAFHDKKVKDNINFYGYSRNAYYKLFYKLINNIEKKKVLDLGCGNGWFSLQLSKKGAVVYGIDISIELLKIANKYILIRNIDSPRFFKMPAERLAFKDNVFDCIIGSAILHHTDIKNSIIEIKRTLRPGGRAIFVEPYNNNIILRLWRKLTPWRRSTTERALEYGDLKVITQDFAQYKINYFVFLSILSEGLLIFFGNNNLIKSIDEQLNKVDEILIKRYPKIKNYCGVLVLELIK
jgi:ubiquinone/menaquinone biosynthesis C-methylase UbiE